MIKSMKVIRFSENGAGGEIRSKLCIFLDMVKRSKVVNEPYQRTLYVTIQCDQRFNVTNQRK